MAQLYINNDMVLQFSGDGKLTDTDGDAVSGATVEATLYEYDGETEVSGQTWPLSLSEDEAGVYSGILDDAIEISQGKTYKIEVVATQGSSKAKWEEWVEATIRNFSE